MRFHLPALPGRPVTKANSSCAYSNLVRKFKAMMEPRGHEVFIYEVAGEPLEFEPHLWTEPNRAQATWINANREEGDFLCIIGGSCQQSITEAVPLMAVEFSVGYGGVFSNFRVFESVAWQHMVYAQHSGDAHRVDGRFYDTVIPTYHDPADFPYFGAAPDRDDYLLYMGRLTERKGIEVAVEVAKATGRELKLAGEGEYRPGEGDEGIEYLGTVGPKERGELMAGTRALLCPTLYIEPFASVVCEAQFCGTPVITTDWGGFTDQIVQGYNGYRCSTLGEFCKAVELVGNLSSTGIHGHAFNNWSFKAVAPKYEAYMERLQTLTGDGWYTDREWLSDSLATVGVG